MCTPLGGIPIERMSDIEVLEFMQRLERERAILDAQQVKATVRLTQLRPDTRKYVGDEIAAALGWSPSTASAKVTTAVNLMERLPDTVDALERGKLDMSKARAIEEWTETLTVEQAREVAATVNEWAAGRTVGAVRQKLSREIIKVDPDGAEARKQHRLAQRKVEWHKCPDGMAELSVYDSAERVRAFYLLLNYLAMKAKAAGDPRSMDELRTEALMQLVLGGPGMDRVHIELRVTIPSSVLAGVNNQPGWLHGYGPVTAQTVWDLAGQSRWWRRLVTDPLTGTVMEVSRRKPPDTLREYLITRNPTCVAVGCGRPSESCALDHNHDHANGGPTSANNMGPTCDHHNLMKLDGGWALTQTQPGHFVWSTPAGLTYQVFPEPVHDPEPPEPQPEEPDDPPF